MNPETIPSKRLVFFPASLGKLYWYSENTRNRRRNVSRGTWSGIRLQIEMKQNPPRVTAVSHQVIHLFGQVRASMRASVRMCVVCVHVCSICLSMHMRAYVYGGQRLTASVFLYCSSILFRDRDSHWNPALNWLDRLSFSLWEYACSCPPCARVSGMYTHTWLSTLVLKI